MFCPKCGENYNYDEPCCPWCGAPKPHEDSSNEKEEAVEIYEKEKIPLKTRLYSKRYVAALILFVIGIICLTVITEKVLIAELQDKIDFHSNYIITFVYLLSLPLLGITAYMYDDEQKKNPKEDSKNNIFSIYKTMFRFFFTAPFKYAYRHLKERNYKALIAFAIYIAILAFISGF